jgi:hypothetical protein
MSNLEEYNTKLEVIKAITDDQIKPPNSIPVKDYIQEAEHLYTWCQEDMDALVAKGLDWTLVEDLPVRCGALRRAQSNWRDERFSREEAEKIWLQESSKGYDFKNEMVHHFYYAFRDSPVLMGRLNDIYEDRTHSGMIQGLNDLHVMGMSNQELLTNIGFDLTQLDLAMQKSDELADIYSEAFRDREDYSEVKRIRDQAFTHLKEVVDMIRQCGQYIFWRNPARVKGYRSNYLRRLRRRSTGDNNEPGTGPETVPEPDEPELEFDPVTTPA